MNNLQKWLALIALVLGLGIPGVAGTAGAGNNALVGSYGFVAQGIRGIGFNGTLSSDGKGNLTGTLQSLAGKNCSFTGSYTVSSNLTGSMNWKVPCLGSSPLTFDFSLVNFLKEIKASETDSSFSTYLEAYWQSRPYSNESNEGTYGGLCWDGFIAVIVINSNDGDGQSNGTCDCGSTPGFLPLGPPSPYSVQANGTVTFPPFLGGPAFDVIDSGTQADQFLHASTSNICRSFDRGGPQVVTTPPTPTTPPPTLAFGSQPVGTKSGAKLVTTEDNQELALKIKGILIGGANPGDFSQTDTCDASVPPNELCKINVTFKPTGKGSRSATLTVSDTPDKLSPHVFNLTGTGT